MTKGEICTENLGTVSNTRKIGHEPYKEKGEFSRSGGWTKTIKETRIPMEKRGKVYRGKPKNLKIQIEVNEPSKRKGE